MKMTNAGRPKTTAHRHPGKAVRTNLNVNEADWFRVLPDGPAMSIRIGLDEVV